MWSILFCKCYSSSAMLFPCCLILDGEKVFEVAEGKHQSLHSNNSSYFSPKAFTKQWLVFIFFSPPVKFNKYIHVTIASITVLCIVFINYYWTDIFIMRKINETELFSYKIIQWTCSCSHTINTFHSFCLSYNLFNEHYIISIIYKYYWLLEGCVVKNFETFFFSHNVVMDQKCILVSSQISQFQKHIV